MERKRILYSRMPSIIPRIHASQPRLGLLLNNLGKKYVMPASGRIQYHYKQTNAAWMHKTCGILVLSRHSWIILVSELG